MKQSASLPRTILAPVLLGVLAVALWQLAVVALEIKPFVLPSPVSMSPGKDSSTAVSTCSRRASLLPRTAMKIV